jgi:hypothetical protein
LLLALNGCTGPLYMAGAGTEWHNHHFACVSALSWVED